MADLNVKALESAIATVSRELAEIEADPTRPYSPPSKPITGEVGYLMGLRIRKCILTEAHELVTGQKPPDCDLYKQQRDELLAALEPVAEAAAELENKGYFDDCWDEEWTFPNVELSVADLKRARRAAERVRKGKSDG